MGNRNTARGMHRLSAREVSTIKTPGRYPDGAGLFLRVSDNGKSWIYRWTGRGARQREMGLGSVKKTSLALAREKAAAARDLVARGLDPATERDRKENAEQEPTFRAAAERYHADNSPTWRKAKHVDAWLSSLELYAFPHFGDKMVSEVDRHMISDALRPIWRAKPVMAKKVLQRIGAILTWAYVKEFRVADAPLVPVRGILGEQPSRKDRHFAAMPWADVPAFVAQLRGGNLVTSGRLALEFLILTAVRSSEVRGGGLERGRS